MGGIIVIDFIDMHTNENKNKVFDRMKKVMEQDRTKHSILPLSRFGLMQITRQRVRPEMEINTREKCPTCGGTGEISPSIVLVDRIENHIDDIVNKRVISSFSIKVHPFIAAYLQKGWLKSIVRTWRRGFSAKIKIVPVSSFDFLEFRFFDKDGKEIV